MFSGVAANIADSKGEAVSEAYDAELRDGVLLEKLPDKLLGIPQHQEISCWPEVFL